MKGVIVMVTLFALVTSYTMKLNPLRRAKYSGAFEERVQIQPLDHFGFKSTLTFPQRYFVNSTKWGGPNSNGSILVFFGGPERIETHLGKLSPASFKSLHVYIEHRFYGKSVPLGSIDLALADPKVRSFLTVEQSLHDFANLISRLKQNFSIPNAKVILTGDSYSTMLATWFRLKYPQMAVGALTLSNPMHSFYERAAEKQPCYIASKVVKEINEKCYDKITQSWKLLDELASPTGRAVLDQTFKSCSPLKSVRELKKYLADMYMFTVQYNWKSNETVNLVCNEIVKSSNILEGIASAVAALNPDQSCFNITTGAHITLDPSSQKAWDWQLCSQLVYRTFCPTGTMFPPYQFDLAQYGEDCKKKYGVYPRSYWALEFYASTEPTKYHKGPEDTRKLDALQQWEFRTINPKLLKDPTWLAQERNKFYTSWAGGFSTQINGILHLEPL